MLLTQLRPSAFLQRPVMLFWSDLVAANGRWWGAIAGAAVPGITLAFDRLLAYIRAPYKAMKAYMYHDQVNPPVQQAGTTVTCRSTFTASTLSKTMESSLLICPFKDGTMKKMHHGSLV